MDAHDADSRWRCRCLLDQLARVQDVVAALKRLQGGVSAPNQAWLSRCLRRPMRELFAFPAEYARAVEKAVVLAAEADGSEVDEALMQSFVGHLQTPPGQAAALAPDWCYRLYVYAPAAEASAATMQRIDALERDLLASGRQVAGGDARRGLFVVHTTRSVLGGGTGCREWQAGHFLANFVLSNPRLFASRSCLELGCGAGMVGVALHRVGAAQITCTDGNLQALANCAANLRLNGAPVGPPPGRQLDNTGTPAAAAGAAAPGGGVGRVCVQQLRWEGGWTAGEGAAAAAPPDVVLGSDLVFDPDAIPALLALLHSILGDGRRRRPGGARATAYLASLRRSEASLACFLAAAAARPAVVLEDVTAEAQRSIEAGVRLSHLAAVDGPWDRVIMHRLRLAEPEGE